MANTKSAIKRIKQNQKRRLRNRLFTGRARTYIKHARSTLEEGTPEDARTATMAAISALDKAAEKVRHELKNVQLRNLKLSHYLANKKQLNTLSSFRMWNI